MTATIRRVVTGHDAKGRAIIASDEAVAPTLFPMLPGFESYELWAEKGPRLVPNGDGVPHIERYFPDADEVIVRFAVFPPADYAAGLHGAEGADEKGLAEVEARYPGLLAQLSSDTPGMHTTDSVDYGIVLSGEVVLELDDGVETVLGAGSCVIQNGTRHAWRNRSDAPVLMAFILLGAERRAG